MTNPWNLTGRECDTIEAVVKMGSAKLAAREIGVAPKTVEIFMHSVRQKMGVHHTVIAAVAYDRFIRGAR